jgi:hypothetical protein
VDNLAVSRDNPVESDKAWISDDRKGQAAVHVISDQACRTYDMYRGSTFYVAANPMQSQARYRILAYPPNAVLRT